MRDSAVMGPPRRTPAMISGSVNDGSVTRIVVPMGAATMAWKRTRMAMTTRPSLRKKPKDRAQGA